MRETSKKFIGSGSIHEPRSTHKHSKLFLWVHKKACVGIPPGFLNARFLSSPRTTEPAC